MTRKNDSEKIYAQRLHSSSSNRSAISPAAHLPTVTVTRTLDVSVDRRSSLQCAASHVHNFPPTSFMNSMSGDNTRRQAPPAEKNGTSKFSSLLNRWRDSDDGSAPFEAAKPRKMSRSKEKNEKAIKDYKKNFKDKNFKTKAPTRGQSSKPAHLQNIFGPKVGEENIKDYVPPVFKKSKETVEMIRKTITKNFFFDDMDSSDLPAFIDAFEPFKVKKDDRVITQGDKGDYFYIVGKDSKVTFEVNGKQVGETGEGGSFGELALLYACPRAATVVAASPTTKLYRVGQKTFRSLLQKQTKRKEHQKMKLLKSVDFLKEISPSDLKRLGRAMTLNVFEPEDVLVTKGDEGDAFYIVHEGGTVEVTDISVGKTKFDNVTLEPGAYFGERALATNEPRAANVIAKTKGSAFRIDRKTFEKVLGKFSRVIMKSQDRRIMEGIEILQKCNLEPKQFEELSNLVVDKKIRAGKQVFDPLKKTTAALFLVREGCVKLSGARTDLIKPGAYFGDDLLLLDTRQESVSGKRAPTRTLPEYSAIVEEDCVCGILSLSDCRTIFDTTKMADLSPKYRDFSSEEFSAELEVLEEDEAITPRSGLQRETTERWLKRTSTDGLRNAVKQNIGMKQLSRHNVLGEGQFGEVWLVSAFVSEEYRLQHFALKTQKKEDPTRGNSIAAIKREIDVLGLMDHPFIVNLVHSYEDPEDVHILMGLVHGGELFDVIHTDNGDGTWSSGIPECDAKFYAMVVADTLDYIHRKQFVYRDLKPENVLIDKDGYPIIVDFGFAKFVEDKTYTLCGTPNYLSPEVIMNRGHGASTDHWALGVLIYEMVAGENPFFYDGMPQMELFQCIVREKFYPLPDEITDDCFYVVDELLEKDPNQRLGSLAGRGKDIMAKAWFNGLDLDDLRQKKFKAPFIPNTATLDSLVELSASVHDFKLDPPSPTNNGLIGRTSQVNSSSLLDDSDDED